MPSSGGRLAVGVCGFGLSSVMRIVLLSTFLVYFRFAAALRIRKDPTPLFTGSAILRMVVLDRYECLQGVIRIIGTLYSILRICESG